MSERFFWPAVMALGCGFTGHAQAALECGPVAGSVNCSAPAYPNGIDYSFTAIGTLALNNPTMTVTTQGVISGPLNTGTTNTFLMANQFTMVNATIDGLYGRGLEASSGGDATVEATNGTVQTAGAVLGGNATIGVLAEVFGPGAGNALVVLNGTNVKTLGDSAYGVYAYGGLFGVVTGSATIRTTNAQVRTEGVGALGMGAATTSGGNVAPVSVTMVGGSVITTAASAPGIQAYSADRGTVTVTLDGNASVSTQGAGSRGIGAYATGITADVQVLSGTVAVAGANADAVLVSSGTTSTVTNNGTLTSVLGDGINATAATGGATMTSTGTIVATAATAAVVRGSAAADTFTATAGALQGNTLMSGGDDTVNLRGTVDISAAPQFDGGAGVDTLNIEGLSMRGFTGANNMANGNNLTLWETINLKTGASLTLTGNVLDAGSGALLTVDASSTLDAKGSPAGNFTVNGSLNNSGVVTLADAPAAADDVLTVANNYAGAAGSFVALNTVLGDSSAASDRLVVQGNSSGNSVLRINNAGGAGAATTGNGILVVQVDGTSDATFTLEGSTITAGAFEYSLHKVGNNWYLQSQPRSAASATPVPTLGGAALLMLAAIMAFLGVRGTRPGKL